MWSFFFYILDISVSSISTINICTVWSFRWFPSLPQKENRDLRPFLFILISLLTFHDFRSSYSFMNKNSSFVTKNNLSYWRIYRGFRLYILFRIKLQDKRER
jgi:hypothetical protein